MNLLKIQIYLNLFFKIIYLLIFKINIKSTTSTIFNLSICDFNNKLYRLLLFSINSGTEYFSMLRSFERYGFSTFLDLSPFPVITIIFVTFSSKAFLNKLFYGLVSFLNCVTMKIYFFIFSYLIFFL